MSTNKQPSKLLLAPLLFINLAPSMIMPNTAMKDLALRDVVNDKNETNTVVVQTPATHLLPSPVDPDSNLITITAYSSTPDQTDDTPFITASGTYVEDGVVACNFLKFGTKVRFPEIYGDKVFTVEDRMAKKNNTKMDIWFPTRSEAKKFGVKKTTVEVIES